MSNPNIASRFDEIYNSTNRAVLAFITAKCARTADINDIYQDTYMELYQVLRKRGVDYVTNEKALVLRIAKRKVARYYSLLERMRIFVSTNVVNEDGEEFELTDLEADAFLTEDFVVNQDLLESAKQLIQSKSEEIQKVFYLKYDVDLTISEIAQALSMSESNVKNKLYRTLRELRNLLG
ncbi:MAG: sigma-70 family RNA polymerase sigma factor [Clostridiaceae bacterium]|nr:sigma-70 family RNA polymerase sigma factor [Clostridiaceae bacterium]